MGRPIQRQKGLPAEVYLPLVDSLYQNGQTLLLATLCVTSAAFITYWKTGEILLLYCTLAIVVVACARGMLIRAYLRVRPTVTTTEAARGWERSYVVGAAASVASLGILVLRRLHPDARFVCPSRQLFNDDRLYGGHLCAKLRKPALCGRAMFMRLDTNGGGTGALRKSI